MPSFDSNKFDSTLCLLGALAAWVIAWVIWVPVLLYRAQGEADALESFVAKATKGSAIGLALCLPWYFVMRKKQSCFCGLGSYMALVIGLWSLLVVGGPLLLFLGRKRRIRANLR